MKIVVDSMFWVAFNTAPRSFRKRLIDAAIKRRVRIAVLDYILEEVTHVLTDYLEESKWFAMTARQRIERRTRRISLPDPIPRMVPNDPKDDAIVQTAITAGADYLVTEDKEILKLRKVGDFRIINATELANLLGWIPE